VPTAETIKREKGMLGEGTWAGRAPGQTCGAGVRPGDGGAGDAGSGATDGAPDDRGTGRGGEKNISQLRFMCNGQLRRAVLIWYLHVDTTPPPSTTTAK